MSSEGQELLLGRIAVQFGMISMDQLSEATMVQGQYPDRELGRILVEQGYLDEAQLEKLLQLYRQYEQGMGKRPREAEDVSSAQEPMAAARAADHAPNEPHTTPAARSGGEVTGAQPQTSQPRDESTYRTWLHRLLGHAVEAGASDVLVQSAAPVMIRRLGALTELTDRQLAPEQAERVLRAIVTARQGARLDAEGQLDLAYTVPDVGRFRANIYRQHRGLNGVFHFIPPEPPSLTSLGLPSSLAKLTNYHQGLVLIAGPAGCGKSSTMAALVRLINEERREHVLTIEDPVEYVHTSRRCVVNQREVQTHTSSFSQALRAALREDPDVIAIGELRDRETISLALSAAETGHLVLGTLHTSSVIRTINRIVGAYPPSQQTQVRTMLSESLRAVIAQRLLPRADESGMVAALELLFVNKAVGNLIRENRTFQIASTLQTGHAHGQRMLDDSLQELVREGAITNEAALGCCDDPSRFSQDS